MAYTTTARINARLGGVLSAGQVTEAGLLIPPAQERIDKHLGRSYETAIVNEPYVLSGADLVLRSSPVASIQSVSRWDAAAHALTPLTANTDYEVRDLPTGALRLLAWSYDPVVSWSWPDGWPWVDGLRTPPKLYVSYTPTATVPELVKLAATDLVIEWLAPILNPDAAGMGGDLKAYSVGQDLSVTFRDPPADGAGLSDHIKGILAPLKRLVFA